MGPTIASAVNCPLTTRARLSWPSSPGEASVGLHDGTYGMRPEDWLKKYGVRAGLGTAKDAHLRFTRSQVGLLDALLAAQPEAHYDAVFARARDQLRTFEGIQPADPPA